MYCKEESGPLLLFADKGVGKAAHSAEEDNNPEEDRQYARVRPDPAKGQAHCESGDPCEGEAYINSRPVSEFNEKVLFEVFIYSVFQVQPCRCKDLFRPARSRR